MHGEKEQGIKRRGGVMMMVMIDRNNAWTDLQTEIAAYLDGCST